VTASEVVTADIARQAGRGLKWTISGQLAMKVGSFAMSLVLARLLAPADFGVYAIALAATAVLIHVNDVGLISATVQWRGRLEEMAPTASLMAAGFAAVIYGLFWFAAPAFASAAGDPAATTVVRLLALTIVIDGITAVRVGAIMRTFQQDKLTIAIAAGLVVNAAVAITLALRGAGAFSFAWGQVAAALVTGVVVMAVARVPVRLGFDRAIAGRLIRYGVPLAAGLGVEAIALNIQFAVVGRIAGSVALGFFLLAYNVSSWAQTILGTAIRYVSVAGFSRLSEHDDEALSAGVQRSMPLLVLVVAPIVTLTSVLAVPLVALLYGERWAPVAPVLQLLAFLTIARMVSNLATDVLMGAGATRASLYINLGWAAALIPALWWATTVDGIRGAAIAQSAVGFVVVIPLAAIALHRVGVTLRPIGRKLVRPLLSAVVAGVVALLVSRLVGAQPLLQLMVGGTAAMLVYIPLAVPAEALRQSWAKIRRRSAPATGYDGADEVAVRTDGC
jgi:O-antigen/teichoic acid export membrane protein